MKIREVYFILLYLIITVMDNIKERVYMINQSIHYWKSYFDKANEIGFKQGYYIIGFSLVNKRTTDIYSKYISVPSIEDVIAFVKLIALPSIYLSKVSAVLGRTNVVVISNREGTLNLFKDNDFVDYLLIDEYEKHMKVIDSIGDYENSLLYIKTICDNISSKGEEEMIISNVEIYKDTEELGSNLIELYEKHDTIDKLESLFQLKKDEILERFSKGDHNDFILKRAQKLLEEKII